MDMMSYPIAYGAINKDDSVRKESSSGGVFYLLAEAILLRGGVVFGAVCDDGQNVRHSYCEKLEELAPFLGSKYVQSKIGSSHLTLDIFTS